VKLNRTLLASWSSNHAALSSSVAHTSSCSTFAGRDRVGSTSMVGDGGKREMGHVARPIDSRLEPCPQEFLEEWNYYGPITVIAHLPSDATISRKCNHLREDNELLSIFSGRKPRPRI